MGTIYRFRQADSGLSKNEIITVLRITEILRKHEPSDMEKILQFTLDLIRGKEHL